MTDLLALINASTTSTTVAKKTSGSSNYELIIIVVLFAVVYFAFIRPRSRRQRAARNQVTSMDIGDRIMSVGGIYGTVVALHDGEGGADSTVEVEVAPGTVLTFLRRAVNPRPPSPTIDDSVSESHDGGYDEADDGAFADPEPYGDFDEHGEFHEHGQTPAHEDGAHEDGFPDVNGAGATSEDEGGGGPRHEGDTPTTGGTGSEGR